MKNQNGSTAFEVIIVLVITVIIGIVGVYVYMRQRVPVKSIDSQKSAAVELLPIPEDVREEPWTVYANEEAGLTFKYPANWKGEAHQSTRSDGGFEGLSGTVTSPEGNILTWHYMIAGGKGGFCTDKEGYANFAPGNNCASKDILSIDKIPSVKAPSGKAFRNIFEDNLYITRTKYMPPGLSGEISYHICLDAYSGNDTPEVGITMGQLYPCDYNSTGFNVKYRVGSEPAFSRPDAKIAEQIMRSFNSL